MKFRRTTLIWVGGLAFVAGMMLARFAPSLPPLWWLLLPPLALLTWRRHLVALLAVIALCGLLGALRAQPWRNNLDTVKGFEGQEVVVEGRVVTDATYDSRGQIEIELDHLVLEGQPVKGKLRLKTFTLPAVFRHDYVRVEGKLRSGFGTRVATMSFAEARVLGRSNSMLERFRQQFSAALYSVLPDEQAALALGILVGQRTNISPESEDNLQAVGLTHIIAVSGYNLTVLVRLLRRKLKFLSKFQSTLLSILLVAVFLMLAGGSASVIRAAWVVGLSLAAGYYGRTIRPLVLLSLSAAATAWFDPYYVWFDLGWWLSFTAFFGVLLLAPALLSRLFGQRQPNFMVQIALESFAASLLTMPLILWAFERVSLVSLLSNMLVVPLVPPIMITCFGLGILYMLLGLSLPTRLVLITARLLLGAVLSVAARLAALPYAEVVATASLPQMLAMYLAIIGLTIILHLRTRTAYTYDILD